MIVRYRDLGRLAEHKLVSALAQKARVFIFTPRTKKQR
jgi:hypothetical protein